MLSLIVNVYIRRILVATAGPLGFAGANLIAAILVQQFASASDFGLYAFGQVIIGAGMGLSNGLFGKPAMAILTVDRDPSDFAALSLVNIPFCLCMAVLSFLSFKAAEADTLSCIIIGTQSFIACFRWYVRSTLLFFKLIEVILMDTTYVILFSIFTLISFYYFYIDRDTINIIQTLCLLCSTLIPFNFLIRLHEKIKPFMVWRYLNIFRMYGFWATIGAISNQIVANSHSYALSFMLGPEAFAPFALGAMLFRPFGVVLTGIVSNERVRLTRYPTRFGFRLIFSCYLTIILLWLFSFISITTLLFIFPDKILNENYTISQMKIIIILTGFIYLLRSMRETGSILYEINNLFKNSAIFAFYSAMITTIIIISILYVYPTTPELCLYGILFGEFVMISMEFTDMRSRAKANG